MRNRVTDPFNGLESNGINDEWLLAQSSRNSGPRLFGPLLRGLYVVPGFVIFFVLLIFGSIARSDRASAWAGRIAAEIARMYGGSFVKLCQVLSSRSDILHPEFLEPLEGLTDNVEPCNLPMILKSIDPQLRRHLLDRYDFCDIPMARCGSVAQVFPATRNEDGRRVAVKIVRPAEQTNLAYDTSLLMRATRGLSISPIFRHIPMVDAINTLCAQLLLQFDMRQEAQNQREFCDAFVGEQHMLIPAVIEAPSSSVLVMDWVDDLRPLSSITDACTKEEIARRCLVILYIMIFKNGCFHCDFHPGNVRIDAQGRIVLLDFGFVGNINREDRRELAKFFLSLASNDPASGAESILASARSVSESMIREKLEADLASLFKAASRKSNSEFRLSVFVTRLFRIQSDNGIVSTPSFALPNLALGMFEGRLKEMAPEIDFQRESIPFVLDCIAGS